MDVVPHPAQLVVEESDSGTETSSMKRKSEDLAYRPEKGNNIYLIWSFNGFGFRFYLLNTLSIFTLIKHN